MDLDNQQLGICNAGLLGVYISNYICNYWYLLCDSGATGRCVLSPTQLQ